MLALLRSPLCAAGGDGLALTVVPLAPLRYRGSHVAVDGEGAEGAEDVDGKGRLSVKVEGKHTHCASGYRLRASLLVEAKTKRMNLALNLTLTLTVTRLADLRHRGAQGHHSSE